MPSMEFLYEKEIVCNDTGEVCKGYNPYLKSAHWLKMRKDKIKWHDGKAKCAVCGKDGEIHHVDTIGMGRDRRTVDDSSYRKICLCRTHHTIAHQRGMQAFEQMYHVYGIVIQGDSQDMLAPNYISQDFILF